jgi:succinyl-diaminopimelate desuccinylase
MKGLDFELSFLSKLVQTNTDSKLRYDYDKCAALIEEEARLYSLESKIINGEKGADDGISRPNVIVNLDFGSDVTLLLESHFDIVPPGVGWNFPPFKLTVLGDRAYGRGTADNKSGIVAALGAMKVLALEDLDINIKLIAGVDEEIGGRYGLDYVLTDYGLGGDAALVLDAGIERLYLGASGIIWGEILVEGIQGHAGYPFKAKNAIEEAFKIVSDFDTYKIMLEKKESFLRSPPNSPKENVWGRFSFTCIKAGDKENVIPGKCEITFDQRLLPEEELDKAKKELTNYFKKIVKKTGCKASLKISNELQGYSTLKENVFVQTVSENISKTFGEKIPFAGELGGNDGSFFAKNDIPVVCCGTIRQDTRYHGIDEFVYLDDIRKIRDLIISIGREKRSKIV